jgi:hypothetical protein
MDKSEYRAVIKFFVKGLTPNEIHSKFSKVYGDSSPSFSIIKKWVTYNVISRRVRVTIVAIICFLFIVVGAHEAVDNIKRLALPWKYSNAFPLLCCRVTKYFVRLFTIKNAM